MAKGQKRSNRETKKPKQVKPKAPTASSTLASALGEAKNKPKRK